MLKWVWHLDSASKPLFLLAVKGYELSGAGSPGVLESSEVRESLHQ